MNVGWTGPWWSWSVFILPQMEQTNLYNAINFSLGDGGNMSVVEHRTVYRSLIATYLCPSDDLNRLV